MVREVLFFTLPYRPAFYDLKLVSIGFAARISCESLGRTDVGVHCGLRS